MNPIDLCERCGKAERGYLVTETNLKLRRVGKGAGGRLVEGFMCSRCVQRELSRMHLGKEKGVVVEGV
jgi:hypothetical protein